MAGKQQVTLTLAGDSSQLSAAFARVGESSRKMSEDVGAASKRVAEETKDGFDKVDSAAEGTYDKFDSLEAVGRGTADTMSGVGEIMSGNVLQGATDLAGGVAALADGFSGALLPAIKKVAQGGIQQAISSGRATAAMLAQRTAMIATSIATRAAAAGQWVLNAAMRANPIGLVITALTLLVGGFILAYRKSQTFRAIVQAALLGVKVAFDAVKTGAMAVFNWFRDNAPKIGGFFSKVGGAIAAPFKAAFGAIRSFWNSTIGGKGFDVPGWVPEIGGKSFRIPYFHTGGIVSGAMGSETLAMVRAGERITGGRNSGGGATLVLKSDGSRAGSVLLALLKETIRIEKGGDVQLALGGRA